MRGYGAFYHLHTIMIQQIDHIGIAVTSLDDTVPYYRDALGLGEPHIEEVATQKVRVAMFDVAGVHIELLEPTSPDSPIAKAMEKNGGRGLIHHIAFKSNDVAGQLEQAKNAGCALINETPVPGAHNTQVAFLHPKSTFGVLTEFCEHPDCGCGCKH
ncbi:glyoxalase/bleomycin resistance protein/dihydroxybiphenyl dioxygenase [Akkermansia glycaniphila]|uniref:Glyoxalase/bleomycin resistance protein/dihydroxybiphenyl dioxygenase n=2 Tax=Akkermansia glycaniphila TaxID=1679444 RepID=A0A1H6KYT1_9BACT|nr:glyoxalase/bleomycin resistance protein/dihydroxybiphenyl dioxygenase [Akkermansia glycaniphila]